MEGKNTQKNHRFQKYPAIRGPGPRADSEVTSLSTGLRYSTGKNYSSCSLTLILMLPFRIWLTYGGHISPRDDPFQVKLRSQLCVLGSTGFSIHDELEWSLIADTEGCYSGSTSGGTNGRTGEEESSRNGTLARDLHSIICFGVSTFFLNICCIPVARVTMFTCPAV